MAKHCVDCGTKLPDKAEFCWKCGKPQGKAQAAPGIVTTTTTTTTTTTGPLPKAPPQQGHNVAPSPSPPSPARQAEPYVAFIIVTMILVLTVLALMVFGYAVPHVR